MEEKHNELIDNYLPNFSTKFRDKISRYRRWEDAQLSLLGRVLLVKGMEQMNSSFEESDLKYTQYNKPYFSCNDISFNISHSGKVVVCALTNLGDIGIDIEKIEPIIALDFKSHMTQNEWECINKSKDSNNSFFNYWTKKESVIKTHGKGLSIPLKSFEVKNDKTTIDSENFFLKEIMVEEGYSCYVALKKSLDTIEIVINKIKC